MWECGLKLQCKHHNQYCHKVTPYVGVWIETISAMSTSIAAMVTPYVGVWIETFICGYEVGGVTSHSLCGSVD